MTLALEVHDLTKAYGRHRAVDALSFTVRAGELACLIGPNGAGKSTTMRTIAGVQLRDTGTIRIAGADVTSAAGSKVACALTPQDLALFDYLTGEETLRLVGGVRNVDAGVLEERIRKWLDITTLDGARGRLVHEYSGGMKRKLAVACAMISAPPLVLLDESFTGLDPESTRALQVALRAYCDEGGAVLLSSHILDMVQAIADRVVIMAAGSCVGELTREQVAELVPSRHPSLTDLYLERTRDVERTDGAPAAAS